MSCVYHSDLAEIENKIGRMTHLFTIHLVRSSIHVLLFVHVWKIKKPPFTVTYNWMENSRNMYPLIKKAKWCRHFTYCAALLLLHVEISSTCELWCQTFVSSCFTMVMPCFFLHDIVITSSAGKVVATSATSYDSGDTTTTWK